MRDLQCLDTLARHGHFARAACACGLSQPAFSARIRNLETRFGVPLVRRGNRYQGLTAEGAALLTHARGILSDVKRMEAAFEAGDGAVTGSIAIGVIPTALVFAARLTAALRAAHPGVRVRLETASSLAIQQGIVDGRFDAGLSYGDAAAADHAQVFVVFHERYALLAPAGHVVGVGDAISWAEAAERPLALLVPEMQNRRIVDDVFDRIGVRPNIVAETTGFTASVALVAQGIAAAVVPIALLDVCPPPPGTRAPALVVPEELRPVGLLSPRRGSGHPAVAALRALAEQIAEP